MKPLKQWISTFLLSIKQAPHPAPSANPLLARLGKFRPQLAALGLLGALSLPALSFEVVYFYPDSKWRDVNQFLKNDDGSWKADWMQSPITSVVYFTGNAIDDDGQLIRLSEDRLKTLATLKHWAKSSTPPGGSIFRLQRTPRQKNRPYEIQNLQKLLHATSGRWA